MDDESNDLIYATAPISEPILIPEMQIKTMGGFDWTDDGLRIGFVADGEGVIDELEELRNNDARPYTEYEILEDRSTWRGR